MEETPILILHGWRVPVERYYPLKEFFGQEGFKVFIPQLPGFNTSLKTSKTHVDKIDKRHTDEWSAYWRNSPGVERIRKSGLRGYNLDDYVDFVIDFLQKQKIDQFLLIGHSFGGRVAIKLAALHPEKVKALVLTGVPGIKNKKVKRLFFLILAKIGNTFFAIPPFCLLKQGARKILYRLAGEWDYYKTKGPMRQTFKKIVAEDLLPVLSKIKTPALLIWGEKDKIVPISVAQKIFNKIPRANLVVVSDASHKLPYENPKTFSEKCLEFFSS